MKDIAKNNFIGTYKIKESICDDLIDLFKKTPIETNMLLIDQPINLSRNGPAKLRSAKSSDM